MTSKHNKYILLTLVVLLLTSITVLSQNDRRSRRVRNQRESVNIDSLLLSPPDTSEDAIAKRVKRDSVFRADSMARVDSLDLLSSSSLDRPVFSGAVDSIIEVLSGSRKTFYYGDVKVEYGGFKLSSDYMEYDMDLGEVFARGTYDSLSGEWIGLPKMEDGGSTYEMEEVRYNFNTRKARITNMVTQQEEGLLRGKNIMMMPDKSINITNGQYTICDAPEPHYYVRMSLAKVITEPQQVTVFGPALPVFEDVPIPIGIPYGFIPKKPQRATGMLTPTFGEETARGFYLRDAGMYFVIGDYLDVSLTGDYYTLGSWAVDLNSRYKVNYKYTGNLAFTYSNDQAGEKGSADFFKSTNFAVRWTHTQDSKARPGTSFSASVNFSSPGNSRYNSHSVNEALQNQISSSISYSKNWNGKFNLSVNALHSQNSRDSSYSFTLPNVTFSVARFYPFKQKNRVGKERFYEKFSLAYNTSLQNKINFKASEFGQPDFMNKFTNGMNHNFSIGLPNFTIAKFFNITPSVSYGQNWFFRTTEFRYDENEQKIVSEQAPQFSTFGITQNYSGAISMSTRLYGMFNFGKYHRVQAIRHVVSPQMSISLSPEKGTYANGWRSFNYIDKNGKEQRYDYNVYAGQLNSPPGRGKSATMSLSVGNNLEAKVRDIRDTTGTGSKKIKLIDQLNLSTSYNFLADSLKMNNIGVTFSTSVFGKLGLSGNLNFDPYAIDPETGRKINTFNIAQRGLAEPVRLTNASASMSYSLSGDGKINGNDGGMSPNEYQRVYYHPVTGEYIPGGYLYYTNPSSPWSVNFSYSFNYGKTYQVSNGRLVTNNRYTQTVNVSGNIRLTPKMSFNASSGFDIMAMKMTTTQISANYDLHCFNIAVSWVPTGTWQSYSFRIAANASALADILRFKKSTSYWDNF